jgi:16S rRNA (adenine1518-N6/adenine1519-N6)-dimethyltransferase
MANSKLGQVFLKDRNIIEKIINTSGVNNNDVVIEIGCGEGWLSSAIATVAKKLYIFEIDDVYLQMTKERLDSLDNVEFSLGDVLKTGFGSVSEKEIRLIANIPYYISAKIVKLVIENKEKISSAVLMVQKEFADKLVAQPGSKTYTSLTLYTRFFMDCNLLFKVSKNCFRPIPKVDSAMIELIPLKRPMYDVDEDFFFSLIRSGFWGRRKPLKSCLSKSPYLNLRPEYKEIDFFKKQSMTRAEELSLEEFYELYVQVYPYRI